MSLFGDRLLSERERLGLSQPAMAESGRVTMRSQRNYEKGERFPDAAYLAAIAAAGADVRYIITGEREGPPPLVLTAEEQVLIDGFRALDGPTRKRMMAFLYSGEAPRQGQQMNSVSVGGSVGGSVAGGNLVIKSRKKAE